MTDPVRVEATVKPDTAASGPPAPAAEQGVRFDDAYWDDAFCAWWDPSMRICC